MKMDKITVNTSSVSRDHVVGSHVVDKITGTASRSNVESFVNLPLFRRRRGLDG